MSKTLSLQPFYVKQPDGSWKKIDAIGGIGEPELAGINFYRLHTKFINNDYAIVNDADQVLTFNDIKAAYEDTTKFVYCIHANVVLIPAFLETHAFEFTGTYLIRGTHNIIRVIINDQNIVHTSDIPLETTDNKVDDISEWEVFEGSDVYYPTVEAILNYLQSKGLDDIQSLNDDLVYLGTEGSFHVYKDIVWQNGYVQYATGVIVASPNSRFALFRLLAGETVTIGSVNNIGLISTTTANAVAAGDTVNVVAYTTGAPYEEKSYTASNDVNVVVSSSVNDINSLRVTKKSNLVKKDELERLIKDITPDAVNAFINTNRSEGETVTIQTSSYADWCCAVVDCSAGDTFSIMGYSGTGGRLWTFVDSNNKVISIAPPNCTMLDEQLTAPAGSAKLILNARMSSGYRWKKGNPVLNNKLAIAAIRTAEIHDMPAGIVRPTIGYHNDNISGDKSTVSTKYGMHKQGDYFLITYAENVDRKVEDHPDVTASGGMKVRYKHFLLSGNTESSVTRADLAKLGDTYTDYNGTTKTLTGGCGYTSGVNKVVYLSSAYTDNGHTLNGFANYNLRPCARTVTMSADGTLSFGAIQELSLTIDGQRGEFNLFRFGGKSLYAYYTSLPPYYDSNGYKWFQPVVGGFVYLTSTDGINWIFQKRINTLYQPDLEVACSLYDDSNLLFVARDNYNSESTEQDCLYIGLVNVDGNIICQYRMSQLKSLPFVVKSQKDFLLFYARSDYRSITCLRIKVDWTRQLRFYKWFSMYHDCTRYTTVLQETVNSWTFPHMYLCGGNGDIGDLAGSSFVQLDFATGNGAKWQIPELPFHVE